MRDTLRDARRIRAVVPAGLVTIVAAVLLAGTSVWLSGGALALGALVVLYAILRRAPAVQAQASAIGDDANVTPVVDDDIVAATPPPDFDPLDWIIFTHLKRSESPRPLGYSGRFRAQYFVDLREASLVTSQRDALADIVAEHIRAEISVEHFHVLAMPKAGNALLGAAVADRLQLAPLLVRDWPIYGRWVESIEDTGRAILFDDVWAEGDLLVETVRKVRDAGFILSHAFLLLERAEGDVSAALRDIAVSHYSAVRVMSDSDLAGLVAKVRRAAPPH